MSAGGWNGIIMSLISGPDALEQLKIPGTLQLLSGQDDTAQADPGWSEAHLLFRKLTAPPPTRYL